MERPVLALLGPTASGKTGVAVELAGAYPIEIVSMDSALVYRDMDIGTAKPDAATLRQAPHHLINLIDPTQRYSAAQFRTDALQVIRQVKTRGNIPLLVGGSMLYYKALVEGLDDLPQADDALRAEIDAEARERGWPALHAELAGSDPRTAARINATDAQRIQRALEVMRISGRPMSSFWLDQRDSSAPYPFHALALVPSDRSRLHQRIEARFDAMLRAGLVEEVSGLRRKYPTLTPGLPSMRCVGYRQVWEHLEGQYDAQELRNRGIYATRQLAKRQLTWLRGMRPETANCLDDGVSTRVKNWVEKALASKGS
ncbi:MAG: tRNA (adenosine(37)-N6)-dimethylallyltransferase MiaA [Thiobacillaceae bacterium]